MDKTDIWSKLAAPLPAGVIAWRQDGKPTPRDGKYFARFVSYIEANTVRERLDAVVPGEWDLTLELMPALPVDIAETDKECSFKARLQVLGVIREDVGTGKDYKQAATDAFKRAAVRFGIAHELYAYEQNWVQVDGDGKYAKPLEDPQTAYIRRWGQPAAAKPVASAPAPAAAADPVQQAQTFVAAKASAPAAAPVEHATAASLVGVGVTCPKCGDDMWDNRVGKRNPKAPDFKCKTKTCEGVIWPPKGEKKGAPAPVAASREDEGDDFGYAPFDDNEPPF